MNAITADDDPGVSITSNNVQNFKYSELLSSSTDNPIVLSITINNTNPNIKTNAFKS